ncbi:MAG: SDR family NAD(P)-dependent oxidoreductase [Ginsengibacter sp.]
MKNLIVTGASGNLGNAVVEKFISENWNVTGTVHDGSTKVSENKNENYISLDLLDNSACESFINSAIERSGNIDAAVLTAGGFAMGSIAETKIEDINKQYELNFQTAYNIARPVFLQMMKQESGIIFLLGSRPGMEVGKGTKSIAYALSKSLIFRLSEIMNADAAGKNVKTIVLVPNIIDTPQNRKSMPDADFSKWMTPAAIAEIIYNNSLKKVDDLPGVIVL